MTISSNESQGPSTQLHHRLLHNRRGFVGWIIGILVVLFLVSLLTIPFFYGSETGAYASYPRPFFFFPFFFFPFGFLIFFFVIFFIIRGIFWGWGWGWRGGYWRGYWRHGGYYYGQAEDILRQRYAKGEITKEQFDQMMRDLQAHPT